MTTMLSGQEKYSILYVNFEMDGVNMMGYGCQSNLYNADLFQKINPSDFYFFNSKIPCNNESSNRLLNQFNINSSGELTDQIIENTEDSFHEYKRYLGQDNDNCVNYYNFSEVKLPSWMCMPSSTSYEEMIQLRTCYISSYQNYSFGSKDKPYQNALERKPLQKVSSFIIVEFDDLAVPLKYMIPLIICTFYPFIISTNLPMIFITQFLIDIYLKYRFLKPEQQIDQNLILQQKIQEKSETVLQKQISFQSPTTIPSKIQNEERNNQTSQELKSIKVENSTNEIKHHIKSLSGEEIKQIKLKFQQQTQKVSKNYHKANSVENSKDNNQNDDINIVDEEQNKHISQSQNETKQNQNQQQKVNKYKNKINIFQQNDSDLKKIQIENV
ncbi:transmembrane protein, putative (macronuclear) [Tetrahymena thermophila SB210]|uniref:Transmembrane protein, putative n=1 Tax=Tetrahymena thermophila (strain SB210) TaxID=312017 RepID=Q22KR6_TETTS|nr:transmembrane protein, putative [Tetrahymena thermophila SB210]EAR85733.1 transmembrane protein, putative [Tetrahymena thermophila SB210]|eukprot:XP_001033396.1 transmembrane protein, putative [Tetrahymena thermophila SB210]